MGTRIIYKTGKRWSGKQKSRSKRLKLPKNTPDVEVKIDYISSKGDGVSSTSWGQHKQENKVEIYVPNTLPGEVVRVQPIAKIDNRLEADLLELVTPSLERQPPECNSFSSCGGCQFQHMSLGAYISWKQKSILDLFQNSNIKITEYGGLFTSQDQKRRRANFKFKRTKQNSFIGFYASKSYQIIELDNCTVLSEALLTTKELMREGLDRIIPTGMTIAININHYENGSDVLIIPEQKLPDNTEVELASWASGTNINRVSLIYVGWEKPRLLYQNIVPSIEWGGIPISPPPGSFLQPTLFGENKLQNQVFLNHKYATHCLDLFAGCGTLSAKLLSHKVKITAIDSHNECLQAYQIGYRNVAQDNLLETETRNLIEAPVMSEFMKDFDGIILDPPRGGAYSQVKQIALTNCQSVTYVSCNPSSFIKDARILLNAGYQLSHLSILDQFSWTAHSELIGSFQR